MVDFVSLFTGMSERDIGFLLKSIVQDSINSQLTNAEISEVDEKTPVLITNSKDVELMNDISIQSAINKEPSTVYLMPEEPDGTNLKLWLKFQNVGELRDYSYQKNKSYSTGGNTMPGLFSKYNSNSMMKYELYSYFNGISHYAYTVDGPTVRILPNITANKVTSFFMRLVPVSLTKLLYAENNALFTKVDDDQLRYGYSVTVDSVGNLHFYIRNDYRQYHLAVIDAYNYILTDPLYDDNSNFRFENFNKKNFLTGFEFLCGLVAAELPFHDWLFKYNPVTHNMSVINTIEGNTSAVVADTSLVTPAPILSLPLQEGKYTHSGTVQTTVYDNSGNGYTGNIVNYTLGGSWEDDNTLLSNGIYTAGVDNCLQIQFGSITALNTLTEFTIAFWYNPLDDLFNTTEFYEMIWRKGNDAANTIWMQRPPQAQGNEIAFRLRTSAGVYHRVDFPNPFPTPYKWYFVVCKWKSGEKLKISIDNSTAVESGTNITDTLTNSTNHFELFNNGRAPKCKIALFRVYNTQITQLEQDDLYYEGYHNPLFPKSENIQPVVEETPDPVLVPFTNVYTLDKMTTPVLADYRRINSLAGDTPLIARYNVDDGVDETDPELNPYTIADGATTVSDPQVIIQGPGTAGTTLESSDSSNGILGDVSGGNERIAMRVRTTGTTIGTNIQGKKITKAVYDMRRIGTVTGTVYCKIWNPAGTAVATIGSVAASSLTDGTYAAVTFENLAQSVTLPTGAGIVDYRIGVEYTTGAADDEVQVRRKSGNLDSSVNQDSWDWGGSSWTTNGNDSFEVKCNLYTGSGTVAAEPNIIMKTGSYNRVVEGFGVSDPLMGKYIGKVTLRLKKVGSPTGTATIALVNNASPPVVKAAIGTLDVSTLTTTTADYTFTNYVHNVPVASGDRLGIIWTPSASGEVHVMTNKGNLTSNTWQGSTSYVLKYISSWSTETTLDLAGKIYTGGNDFDAELRFSTTRTRIGEKAVNSSSDFHNRKINKVLFRAKKVGTPAGIINCYVRDPSDNIKVTFSSVDISTVGTSLQDIVFENYTHNYLINSATGSGDKVIVEYSGSTVTDYLQLNTDRDTGTLNSITQTYDSGNYVDNAQRHLAGHLYEGGEPDLVSRTRVAQSIEHQNSRLKGKKITRVKAFLIRTTTGTTGTAYCNVRNSSDSLIKTLGTVAVSSLNTTAGTPSQITFTDVTNNYPLNVGDKITIEFNGGNTTDQLGVLVREVFPNYDWTDSMIRKYDEVDYDDFELVKDLCATMDEGGFYFTPEPNSIPDPTPTNIKDLLYCAGNNAKSGFFETFLMEFRIYAKDITLDNADNLYNNRYSISAIGNGQLLMPFSLKCNTLDPV
jgi:hypothetical protein